MAAQRITRGLSMMKRALGMQASAVLGKTMSPHTHQSTVLDRAFRGFATFDQAMQRRLASLANVKIPYPLINMMEDSKKFRKRTGAPKPTDTLPQLYSVQDGVDKCELRVHLCPPPWFYNIHGVWLIGRVNGVWVVHCVPNNKQYKSNTSVASQQLVMVDTSTRLMMNEYWKSIHGVQRNPSLWIHENAKHSYYDATIQMPNYFDQVITMGTQIIALLWKLGFQPNAFYDRDHFLGVLKKNQGVDVYLDFVEDAQTGIVYLEAYGFYFEKTITPAGDWTKKDHPSAWIQENGHFYLVYGQ